MHTLIDTRSIDMNVPKINITFFIQTEIVYGSTQHAIQC